MAQRSIVRQLLLGIPFLIVYVAILFPLVFLVSIVLGIGDVLSRVLLRRPTENPARIRRLWDWNGNNALAALTGEDSFELAP